MEKELHKKIKLFLKKKKLPKTFPSNKANFIQQCSKYKLNRKGNLTRDGKEVVTAARRDEIFEALHDHSGRTPCWERIQAR